MQSEKLISVFVKVPPDWLTCGTTAVPGPEVYIINQSIINQTYHIPQINMTKNLMFYNFQVPIQIQQRIIQESKDPQEQQEAR